MNNFPLIVKILIVFFALAIIYLYVNPNSIVSNEALGKVCSTYINVGNAEAFECENNDFGAKYKVLHPPDECFIDLYDSSGNRINIGCCGYGVDIDSPSCQKFYGESSTKCT